MTADDLFMFWSTKLQTNYRETTGTISCSLLALAFAERLQEENQEFQIMCWFREMRF